MNSYLPRFIKRFGFQQQLEKKILPRIYDRTFEYQANMISDFIDQNFIEKEEFIKMIQDINKSLEEAKRLLELIK